jgi:hypothetical protein
VPSRTPPAGQSLADLRPDLAQEWHPTRNDPLSPSDVRIGSGVTVWWAATHDDVTHEWKAAVGKRVGGAACGVCSGRQVQAGINDLQTAAPAVAATWHPDRNGNVTPQQVTAGSNTSRWWLCDDGHPWEASPNTRVKGHGCPTCMGRIITSGVNDLTTTHPQLLAEWHPDNAIDPTAIGAGNSRQHIRWLGRCGHSWETTPYNRKQGKGCPYCTGRLLLRGFNDLATLRPDLSTEWHADNTLTPSDVQPGSDTTVLWQCARSHSWPAQVKNRDTGYGCPRCARTRTSGAEQAVLTAVRTWLPDAAGAVRLPNTSMGRRQAEADIVGTYRGASIVIEYDGEYWHRHKADLDQRKTKQILSTGAHLIRVREHTTTHHLDDVPVNHPRLAQLQHPNARPTDTTAYQHLSERIRDACDTMLEQDSG